MITRIMGLNIKVKADGSKTAWQASYWVKGKEADVTGWDMWLPTGERVPQVSFPAAAQRVLIEAFPEGVEVTWEPNKRRSAVLTFGANVSASEYEPTVPEGLSLNP